MNISGLAMALDVAFDAQPDGQTYLDAYEDPVGIWTIGDGIIRMPNGEPVKKGDKLTAQQARILNSTTTDTIERDILRVVKVPLNQNQFDALFLLVKNIGIGAFGSSSVLQNLNAGRYADAAYHFGDWVYATKRSRLQEDGSIKWATDPNGDPMPLGRKHYVAFRGLYRRHISEALLFLGLNWTRAAHEDRIELQATPVWESAKNRWKDRVDFKTEWEDILREARKHPLPVMQPDKPRTVAQENADTVDLNNAQLIKLGGVPGQPIKPAPLPEAAKAPVAVKAVKAVQPPNINPALPAKRIEDSTRGKEVIAKARGRDVSIIGTVTGTGVAAAATNAEKVGKVVEGLKPETWGIILLAFCAGLVIYGVVTWWWSRNSLWERRDREQEPVY